MVWLCASLALADAPGLTLERGWVALEQLENQRALELASASWAEAPSWEGRALYLKAAYAAGLGLWVDEAPEQAPPRWREARAELERAVTAGDDKRAVELALQAREAWPDRPDVFDVLWAPEAEGRVLRHRNRLLKELADPEIERDAATLYRIRRLLKLLDQPLEGIEARLAAAGETVLPVAPPRTRHERSELARHLGMEPFAGLPRCHPDDLLDIAGRMAANYLHARARADAVATWRAYDEVRHDPWAALGLAAAHFAGKDLDRAEASVELGLVRVVGPWRDDVGVLRDGARAELLASALEARARILELRDLRAAALVDLFVANHLAGELMNDGLEERMRKLLKLDADETRNRYRSGSGSHFDRAVRAATADLDAGRAEAALDKVGDALFILSTAAGSRTTRGLATASARELVQAKLLEARSLRDLRHRDAAAVAAEVAHQLSDGPNLDAWALRAELLQAAGHDAAAFNAWAVVRRGRPETEGVDAALQQTWNGIGSWERAADRAGAQLLPVIPAPPGPDGPRAPSASAGRSSGPALGERMPAWSVTNPYGTVSSRNTVGRLVVMTFWSSDCALCLGMLQDIGRVARDLRRESRDISVVAVSWDGDEQAYEGGRNVADEWGEVFRDPALAARLGATGGPAVWIIDPRGHVQVHLSEWVSRAALERHIRRVLAD